ncbi:VCBS domain-containing protein [Aeromonas veronii]
MAKKPQPHELTPEQKAAQLKPREHQLGGAEVHTGDEIIIGWESTLNEAPVSAEASSLTTGQEPSHLSSHTIDDRQSESRLPVSGLKSVLESHAHHPVPPSSELSRPAGRLVDQPLVSGHDTTAFYGSVSADPKTAEVSPLSWQADATDSQPSGDIPSAISGTLSPQVLAAHDEQSPPTYFQLQGVVQGEVTEDQGVDAYGALTVTGHPSSDLLWYVASRQGVFGTLDIDQQGQWHYQLENSSSKVQALVTGQSMAESFVVLVADSTGVTHMTQLQIRVNGSNDLPVMAVVTPLDTHEGGIAVHGQLSATDLDAGDQLIFSAAHPVAGFVLHDDGQYVFDPSSPVYDHLKSGEQQILDIPVAVTDRQGAQDTRILRIILTGSNDLPALQIVEVRSAQEDVPPLHGQLLGTDPDRGDTLVYSTTLLVSGFSLHTDGSYSFDPSHASYQHLAAGQTRDVVIPITVTDSVGASSTQNLTIKLTGSNDGATIAGVSSGSTSEDNTQAVTGQLTITDMDDGEAYFVAQSGVVGTYGTFTMNEQGQWRYQLDNRKPDVQSLKTGDQVTDSFTVHSADGTEHTVTVTITGTNDAPTVAHALTTTTAAEDVAFSFGIPKDTFADLDTGDTLTLSTGSLPAWLHFDAATGTFNGTPANGDVGTQHITVTATDGSGAQVSSTFDLVVSNTNDAPMLNSIASVRVTEDCAQATGQFTATDPDTGDTLIYSIAQPVDGLTVNADGSWSFDPAHASYQHLTAGQTQVLTIPVTVTDSAGATSTQDLVIKVNGTNDGAVIAGTDVGTVTEDQTAGGSHYLQATGTLSVTDVDAGEAVFRAGTSTGHYGDLVLHRDGQWMYQADNSIGAVQALKAGQQLTESFTVHSADGTTHTITVTVIGTNDSPTVTHVLTTRTATEDAAFSFGVPAGTFSDIDTGDALTLSTGALPAWLHFDATTGTFSGTPANGDVGTIPITVTAIDSSGAQVSTTFNLVVNNTNDAPMLSSIASVRVTEDGAQASGQFTATDPDTGDTLTYSISYAVDGFTLNANGSYSFDPSHASYQQLVAGQTQVLQIPVTVTDSAGATSTQNLSITITGINERAMVVGVDSASLREDVAVTAAGKLVATGQLSIVDPDAGQAHFVAQPATPGTYGVFSIDAAGVWHYEVNNARTEIQQLKAGETITDSMTATTMDGSTHQIQITIIGANDAPVLTAQTQSLSEDGHLFVGQLHANDVDLGDTLQFSTSATVAGFTLNSDGTYQFDPANAAYQHVAAGQTQVLTIPVTVTDAAGATSTQNLSITVTGTNDGPIIAGLNTGSTSEDSPQAVTGRLTIADVDDGQAHFVAQNAAAGSYGSLTLTEDGQWSYQLDNSKAAVQALKTGETVTDSFTVSSADGTTHTVSVTVAGRNDGAVIAGTDTGSVTEDTAVTTGHLQAIGQLTITDPDAGQAHFTAQTDVAGSSGYGHFSVDAAGAWTYSADNTQSAIQQLKAGDSLTDTLTVTSADGTTHTLTVTIHGTNDAPVLQAQNQAVTEDGTQLSGHMVATDVDAGDTQTFSIAQAVDGFTLNANGSYSFDPSHASYQHLTAGQTQAIVIPITVTDSAGATSTQNLSITVTGRNDGPTIAGVNTGSTAEDSSQAVTGQLTIADLDDGQAHFVAQNAAGSYGSLTLAEDGQWSYQLDNSKAAVQALKTGQTVTDSFTFTTADGTTHTVSVTVAGRDDGAVIAGTDTGSVTEDTVVTTGHLQASGQLTISDPDAGQAHFIAQSDVAASYGHFSVDASGAWTYSADNTQTAVQQLKAGESLADTLTVASADGTTHTITVTLNGTNDALVLAAQSQAVTEDGSLLSGHMVATDADASDTQTFSLANAFDGFTLNADGSYSFDPSHASYQHLAAGQTQDVVIPITVTDSTGLSSTQNLTITVTGSNDGPTIAGVNTGSTTEDSSQAVTGQLTIADLDDGQAHFVAQNAAGSYGSLTLAEDGQWRYQLDNSKAAVQALKTGQTVTDSFTVTSADGTTHTVTVTLHGTNDAPVLQAQTQAVTEDGTQLSGHMVATDVDAGDTKTFSTTTAVDGFTLSADGTYQFDPTHASYQHLAAGQTQDVVIPITVTDSTGLSSTQNLTITVTGSNDGPLVVADTAAKAVDAGTINEDAPHVFSEADLLRLVGVSDVDDGSSMHIVAGSLTSTHGTFTGDAAHGFTFTPAANFSGQDVDLKFSVTDGTASREAFATLDITPVADAPDRLADKPLSSNFDDAAGAAGWQPKAGRTLDLQGGSPVGGQAVVLTDKASDQLHQDLDTFAGQRVHLSFDVMGTSHTSVPLQVLWEGKVVANINPKFAYWESTHTELDLVATGPNSRLEFRTDGDRYTDGYQVRLDNVNLRFDDIRSDRLGVTNHDLQLQLGSEFRLTDSDGSESVHYLIKGLPVGFTLTDGTHSVTVGQADQEIDTRGWQQDALRVQAPHDYTGAVDIQVTARSEEAGNAVTADSQMLPMRLSFESADVLRVIEDTPKTFSADKLLALAGVVAPPGEHLSLSDVTVDPAFGHLTHNSNGSWTFTPAANVSADQVPLTLTVAGGTQPVTASLALSIAPVVDAPVSGGGLTVSTDFDHQGVGGDGWAFVDGTGMGWHTDYAKGIQVGQDKLYGGSSTNQIVELAANAGNNIYRDLPTTVGQALHFGFDLSARAGNTVAALEVLWEGKVIDTITPGSSFGLVHHEYDLVATGANSRIELRATGGDGRSIIDNIAISPPPVVGLVNHAVSLDVSQAFHLADTDGSETISYLIKDLPVGATLSDGSHSVTVAAAGEAIDIKGWQLDTLTLQAPKDFEGQLDFKISATAEEGATHETAMSTEQAMRLTFEHLETAEDTPRTFSESELLHLAGIRAPAGQTYALSDVQVDPAFGQVTHNADGSWTFTPAANVSVEQVALMLTVTGGAQPITAHLPLSITPVTDTPVLSPGLQGSLTDFDSLALGSKGWDTVDPTPFGWRTDGGGRVEVAQDKLYGGSSNTNVEVDLIANAGKNLYQDLSTGAGKALHLAFDLSARPGFGKAQLEVLWEGKVIDTITPGADGYAMQHHEYDLVATGDTSRIELRAAGSGDVRALLDNIQISPALVQLAQVNHDLHLKLDDYVHLADTDGSETLSYLIKGLPVGFTLTDGSHSITVTAADQVVDTKGWQQDALSVQAPQDFAGSLDLRISGRSEEGSTHQTATSAELPVRLSFESLSTSEDTPLTLSESKLLALAGVVLAAGEHLSLTDVQVDAAFGQFSHNADGSWTFTPAANVNADQVPFTLTVSGGSQPISSSLQLSITPVNDAPVLAAQTQTVTEDDSLLRGHMVATDVDTGDTGIFSLANAVDGFTLNADGSYSFDPGHASYQHLAAGQTQDVVIPITVTDSAGATSTQSLTITVMGSDDITVISGDIATTLTEDQNVNSQGNLEHFGKLSVSASDSGTAEFVPQNSVQTQYGRYTIDQTGFWLYEADNKQEAIQQLKTGEHLTDSFTVHSADGTAQTITVTIQGQDDAARFSAVQNYSDDIYIPIGVSLMNAGPKEFLYISEVLLANQLPRNYVTAEVAITTPGGIGLRSPDGSISVIYHSTGGVANVPLMDLQAWHNKGAGYEVVVVDHPGGEIQIYAHDQGNPNLLSGFNAYVTGISNPAQASLGFNPTMHDVWAASVGAAVQGAAVMPPAIAPLDFDSGHVLEDNGQQISGFIEVKDADAGQSAMTPQTDTATHYGRFSIDVNGDWIYQLDNSRPEVQQLGDGQTLVDTITVLSEDGTAHEVAITIHGQNDGAVIAGADSGRVVEDDHVTAAGTIVAKGLLTVTDSDAGQAAFVAQNDVVTQYGHFSLAADGHWTYTVDNNRTDIQALKPGGMPGETADVSLLLAQALGQSNEAGFKAVAEALTQQQPSAAAGVLDLSIQGAAIVLSGPTGTTPVVYAMDANGRANIGVDELLSWLHQGKGYELHLQGSQSDVQVFVHDRGDAGDLHPLPLSAATVLNDPASAAQHLALSWQAAPLPAELSETVTVQSVDGTEHIINLSIVGTAENAVIAGVDRGSVTEDAHVTGTGQIEAHGKLTIQDTDGGQAAFTSLHQVAGKFGYLSLQADGQWTYSADNNSAALNALNKGQLAVEAFVVKSVDGTAHTLSITVNGADEKPDLWPEIARNLMAQSGGDTRGYHVIAEHMAAGDSNGLRDVVMNVYDGKPTVVDASGHVLHTFDRYSKFFGYYVPMNELADQLKAHPGAMLVLQGSVGGNANYYFHDASNEMLLNFNGAYSYEPDKHPIGGLPINGIPHPGASVISNMPAQLGGADSGSVLADGDALLQTQGHLTVLDADGGQAHFNAQQSVKGQYGQFSIDAQGHWQYQADGHAPALSQLAAGQLLSETFTVHSVDGTSHTITVQLFGDNASAAVISGADTASLSEDQAVQADHLRASGQLNITDGDAGQAHFNAQTNVAGSAGLGHFSLDTSGAWTYAVDNSKPQIQQLKAGETVTDTLTVSSADGTTHQITVTLSGSNDAAVITGADSGAVSEDGGLSASGKLVISDVDSGQASFTPQHQAAAHGSFTLTASGDWTYTLDNHSAAVQALKTGESLSDSITVQSVDGSSHVVIVRINGANDAPVLQAQSQTVAEDGSVLRGQMQASDADHGEHLQFSTSAQVAGFSLHADGSYSFNPGHADYQSLTAGQQRDLSIPVVVTDASGAHATQMLTLHITGSNDGAVISGVDTGHVQVGGQAQVDGQLQVSDADAGQAGFQAGQIVGSFGSLSIDAQGRWQYQLDTSNAQVQRLGWQDRVTDSVTVHSLDGTAQDVNIQVTGSASVPLYSSVQPHSGMDAYGNILAAVHGAGYQYQGLADALDKGDSSVVANMALSISGSHVEVIDTAGNVLQTFSPVGVDYAATMSMHDLMQWHAQGFGIIVHEDSGMDSTRMWLHNMGDPHNIRVRLPDGTGFDGWADKWTFGELPLNAMPAPAPVIASDEQSVELTDMRPSQSAQVNIEVTPVAGHDVPQQLIPVSSDMTASDGVSTGIDINDEQQMGIAPHVADYWQFADLSGVVQGDKSDGHPFADQVSGYLDAAGIHVEGWVQVMPPMPPVEALMDQHVNGSNDEHHMTSLDESVNGSETGESLLAPEEPSHQHHG